MVAQTIERAGELLNFFGYTDFDPSVLPAEQQSICRTPFFPLEATPERVERFNGFKELNSKGMAARLRYKSGQLPEDGDRFEIGTDRCDKAERILFVTGYKVVENWQAVNHCFEWDTMHKALNE